MKKIVLSLVLVTMGLSTLSASSVVDITKDALINTTEFTVAGTFGKYDFAPKGDNNKFDWAFTTATGDVYQLRGTQASANDVFGWAKAPAGTVAPTPAWYMFQVDVDGDGTKGKFDWVLLSATSKAVYKLNGVAADGGFAYAGPIDIDYKVNGSKITTGVPGSLSDSSSSSSSSQGVTGESINSADLAGWTVVSEYKSGVKFKDIKTASYIFLQNNQVIIVFDLFDGSRRVARGAYNQSHGNNVAIINPTYDDGKSFVLASGISTPNGTDLITVGKSNAFPYTVTKIVANNINAFNENTVTTIVVDKSTADGTAPMYDQIKGKSNIIIFNNFSSASANETHDLMYPSYAKADSSSEIHCTDYDFTDVFLDSKEEDGIVTVVYLQDGNMCYEFDYKNHPEHGSLNTVFYPKN